MSDFTVLVNALLGTALKNLNKKLIQHSPVLYLYFCFLKSEKEFCFNQCDKKLYIDFINRFSYIKNNLSFIETSDDVLFGLYVDQRLIDKLDPVNVGCIVVPPEGVNLTSHCDFQLAEIYEN